MPEDAPVFGCNFNTATSTAASCTNATQQYNLYAALDNVLATPTRGVMSMPVANTSYWLFQYVFYQVRPALGFSSIRVHASVCWTQCAGVLGRTS